ncbi:MAG: 2OG-Fe(II) oxygenase [Candidatus Sericytochromatia bacterium]
MEVSLPVNDYLTDPISLEGVFSPEECQTLISLPCTETQLGKVVDLADPENKQTDFSQRYTICRLVDPIASNHWIFERIKDAVNEVNRAYFKVKTVGFASTQILEYPLNGFYEWHVDIGKGVNSTRKLSIVVQLSDPGDYTGGRLLIGLRDYQLPVTQGAMIVFPSYLLHKVTPVESGKRFSLVTWSHGPAYS